MNGQRSGRLGVGARIRTRIRFGTGGGRGRGVDRSRGRTLEPAAQPRFEPGQQQREHRERVLGRADR